MQILANPLWNTTMNSMLLQEQSKAVGYRYMTDYLRREGIHVRRDSVMVSMKEADPLAVQYRRRQRSQRKVYTSMGPNHVRHVDGYDKLKPYGFPIHGCIDRFSRHVIWLTVGPTNNNPEAVAQNYMSCVQSLKGAVNCLNALSDDDIEWVAELKSSFQPTRSGSDVFDWLAEQEFIRNNWTDAEHWEQALYQYIH